MPSVQLILMDHDTCLTCLWEVEELLFFCSRDLRGPIRYLPVAKSFVPNLMANVMMRTASANHKTGSEFPHTAKEHWEQL